MDFSGAYTAIITPFDENGDIDEAGFKENIKFQIKEGIDGIIPVGTTGESPTVTEKEHEHIIDMAVEAAKGKIKVIAGTGSNSTDEAVHYTRYAKEAGVDAVLLVSPYYNKPTPEGMYQHFKTIAEAVDIPQILYNVPGRTGKNVDAETTLRLSKVKNIIGIKEASCDLEQIMKILKHAPPEFTVLSGEDSWTFAMMCLGAKGVISVASNVAPGMVSEMVHRYMDDEVAEAKKLHYKLYDLFKVIFVESNPGPIKAAMEMMKMPAGKPRLPLVEPTDANKEKIRKVLQELKLV